MDVEQALPLESVETVWSGAVPGLTIHGVDHAEQWLARAAEGPVIRFPQGGILVCTPSAVDHVLHHPEVFSSNPDAMFLGSADGLIPIQTDPPEHTRWRRLLDSWFAPKQAAALEPSVIEHTNRCIDAVIDDGHCDVVPALGAPVPSGAILTMLGFPSDRLSEFMQVKDDILRPSGEPGTPEFEAHKEAAGRRAFEFFGRVLDERYDAQRDDFASWLTRLEKAGDVNRSESFNICLMLVIAGLDTVTATITNIFYWLAQREDLRRRLVEDPELVPAAVEEFLRYIATVPAGPRVAMTDADVEGCPIRAGERIMTLTPISNFDASVVESPCDINFDRVSNRHASFGLGKHRCLGSHLARMELQVMVREWHRRIPDYRLKAGHTVTWRRGIREITGLPLTFPKGGR